MICFIKNATINTLDFIYNNTLHATISPSDTVNKAEDIKTLNLQFYNPLCPTIAIIILQNHLNYSSKLFNHINTK